MSQSSTENRKVTGSTPVGATIPQPPRHAENWASPQNGNTPKPEAHSPADNSVASAFIQEVSERPGFREITVEQALGHFAARSCVRPIETSAGPVRCDSRFVDKCPSCARLYEGDYRAIQRDGWNPRTLKDNRDRVAKKINEYETALTTAGGATKDFLEGLLTSAKEEKERLDSIDLDDYVFAFLTLTAPGKDTFGPVHRVPKPKVDKYGNITDHVKSKIPCDCGQRHSSDRDDLRGVPLHIERVVTQSSEGVGEIEHEGYRYEDVIRWNAAAPQLWNRTARQMRYLLPSLQWFGTWEFQERGLLHLHVVLRIRKDDLVNNLGEEILDDLPWYLNFLTSRPWVKWDGLNVRWGTQKKTEVFSPGTFDASDIEKKNRVFYYLSKALGYLVKDLGEDASPTQKLHVAKLNQAAQSLVPDDMIGAYSWGFRGHPVTKSRGWGFTGLNREKAKQRRLEWARQTVLEPLEPIVEEPEPSTDLIHLSDRYRTQFYGNPVFWNPALYGLDPYGPDKGWLNHSYPPPGWVHPDDRLYTYEEIFPGLPDGDEADDEPEPMTSSEKAELAWDALKAFHDGEIPEALAGKILVRFSDSKTSDARFSSLRNTLKGIDELNRPVPPGTTIKGLPELPEPIYLPDGRVITTNYRLRDRNGRMIT